jgi:exonuclease VII large subunit
MRQEELIKELEQLAVEVDHKWSQLSEREKQLIADSTYRVLDEDLDKLDKRLEEAADKFINNVLHQIERDDPRYQAALIEMLKDVKQYCTVETQEELERIKDKEKRVSLYPDKETEEYMEGQGKIFDEMLPVLHETYAGKYVYFEDGKVLDCDDNRNRLVNRIFLECLIFDKQIFIEQVPFTLLKKLKWF